MPSPLPGVVAGAVLLLAALPALAQPPGPLAQARGDIDGDGKTDEVRVSRSGEIDLLIAGAARGTVAPLRFATISGVRKATAAIDTSTPKKSRVLVVGWDDAQRGEALWIGFRGRRARVLWTGPVGLIDADTKTTREVVARDGVLHRYVSVPAVRRCDREPAMLEHESLGAGGKMVAADPPARIASSAKTLTATVAAPPSVPNAAVGPNWFKTVHASSNVAVMSVDLLVSTVVSLGDGDVRTAWSEARPSSGAGEFITATSTERQPVAAIRIVSGNGRTAADFAASGKPKRIGLVFDSGDAFWVELPRTKAPTPAWIALPKPVTSRCVTLVLDEIWPSRRRRGIVTSISELAVLTTLDLNPGGVEAALVDQILAGGPARPAQKQLRQRDADAVAKAIAAALATERGGPLARLKLRRVLAHHRRGAAEIARGVAQREAAPVDIKVLLRGLVAMGDAGAAALARLAADRRIAAPAREASAAALLRSRSPNAPAAAFSLVAKLAASGGQRGLRKALSVGLGKRRGVTIDQLLAAAAAADRRAAPDLWRAVGVHATGNRSAAGPAVAAMSAALASAKDYELRYRLLQALGRLPDSSAIAATATALEASRAAAAATDVALRRVATLALARNKDTDAAAPHLLAATQDTDVQVRLHAIDALAGTTADGGSDDRLGELLKGDTWPRVRRAAAAALAPRCLRPAAQAHLRVAARAERNLGVGTVVLSAIVACGGPDVIRFLIRLAKTAARPTGLRAEAIKQVAVAARERKDTSVTPTLIAMFEQFISDAFSDEDALALAQASARALCRVGDRRAIDPLIAAARESAYLEVQASATRSLGCYCTKKTATVLRKLAATTKVSVSVAANAALKQCQTRRR